MTFAMIASGGALLLVILLILLKPVVCRPTINRGGLAAYHEARRASNERAA